MSSMFWLSLLVLFSFMGLLVVCVVYFACSYSLTRTVQMNKTLLPLELKF